MTHKLAAAAVVWVVGLGVAATSQTRQPPTTPAAASGLERRLGEGSQPAATQTLKQYCIGCHHDRSKSGDLSLARFDVACASEHPEISENIIRKLRAGMMPPSGSRRPDEAALLGVRRALETQMDRWAAAHPNPG